MEKIKWPRDFHKWDTPRGEATTPVALYQEYRHQDHLGPGLRYWGHLACQNLEY